MKPVAEMVAEANRLVPGIAGADAAAMVADPQVCVVDLRDPRELERDGMIPGAFHCPRGMLEFWIDPASPYAKPQFQEKTRFLFYCASGWRSALSARTAVEMGLPGVTHILDGFKGWKAAGHPVAAPKG